MAYINYLLLDAFRMDNNIATAKSMNPLNVSLFKGRTEVDLAENAPYIFSYNSKSEFAEWFMKTGWGKGWGIMLRSHVPVEELHKHCRSFLVQFDDSKQEIYFRYYDPRVLSIFLPTCSKEQLRDFFGPIDYFIIEDDSNEHGQMFWLEDYELKTKRIDKNELVNRIQNEGATSFNSNNKKIETNQINEIDIDFNSDIEPDNATKWNKFFFD
jgi:hypothetical protein